MQLPSKGKHSPPFSALLYYGCFYLGFYGKRGLHGHYVCTESRWPSITCYLGKQSWAPRAAVIFLPQAGDSAEELWLWVTALSSHSAPRSEHCVCSTAAGSACWALAEQTQSWATGQKLFPVHTAPCFQTLMGLHTFPISFFPERRLFLVLLQINLSLTFVWSDCSKMWPRAVSSADVLV